MICKIKSNHQYIHTLHQGSQVIDLGICPSGRAFQSCKTKSLNRSEVMNAIADTRRMVPLITLSPDLLLLVILKCENDTSHTHKDTGYECKDEQDRLIFSFSMNKCDVMSLDTNCSQQKIRHLRNKHYFLLPQECDFCFPRTR